MSVFYPPHFRHLESKSGLHGDELPRSTGTIAVGTSHVVVRTPAGVDVMPGERGGPLDRTPELLDLARIRIGLPQALACGREVRDHGHREIFEVFRY